MEILGEGTASLNSISSFSFNEFDEEEDTENKTKNSGNLSLLIEYLKKKYDL